MLNITAKKCWFKLKFKNYFFRDCPVVSKVKFNNANNINNNKTLSSLKLFWLMIATFSDHCSWCSDYSVTACADCLALVALIGCHWLLWLAVIGCSDRLSLVALIGCHWLLWSACTGCSDRLSLLVLIVWHWLLWLTVTACADWQSLLVLIG